MDPLIEAHITTAYTPEIGVCMFEAFALLDNFDVQDYQLEFISLLMSEESMHREELVDKFRLLLVKWIDFVLTHHMVQLTDDCPLRKRVAVLSALYMVQDLQDYTTIAICLESDQDPVEKFAFIVNSLTELTEEDVLENTDHIDPLMLDNLYKYAISKGGGDVQEDLLSKDVRTVVSRLACLMQFNKNVPLLGNTLLDNGALPNQPFTSYLPYISGYFEEMVKHKDSTELAKDVYSLLCLSGDGKTKPFDVFKENSSRLFPNTAIVTRVDVALLTVVGQFTAFEEAYKHEKARVS